MELTCSIQTFLDFFDVGGFVFLKAAVQQGPATISSKGPEGHSSVTPGSSKSSKKQNRTMSDDFLDVMSVLPAATLEHPPELERAARII